MTANIVADILTKTCPKCRTNKPRSEFCICRCHKDGLSSYCRTCMRQYNVRNYQPTNDPSLLKICVTCQRSYPNTVEFFHKGKRFRDGLRKECKSCANFHRRSLDYAVSEGGTKICSLCKTEKSSTREYFYRHHRHSDGLSSICIECDKQKHREWRRNNPEVIRELSHKNYIEHKADYQARSQKWIVDHPERAKEIARVRTNRRNARKKQFPVNFTSDNLDYLTEYFHGCCAVCGRQLNNLLGDQVANLDHWIPLNDPSCPGTVAINMVLLCGGKTGCNQSKGDITPLIWLNERFGKRKAKHILVRIQAYFDSLATV